MGDNLLDDLDGLLLSKNIGDESFRNELSYYGAIKGVSVDREVLSVYDRKTSVGTNAARIIKSDNRTVKYTKRGIEDAELSFKRESLGLREMIPEILKARKESKNALPFSSKAREAKQKYKHLKRQYRDRNRNRHRIKERIAEDRVRLAEKEAEIKDQTAKLEEATTYIGKLEAGIRKQFNTVNKMLATRDFIKSGQIDFNDPTLKPEYKAALIKFSQLLKQPMKISIVEPLTDPSSEIMQVYSQIQSLIQDKDRKAIQAGEQQRALDCKTYIKRLQEDPSLDKLDDKGNSR